MNETPEQDDRGQVAALDPARSAEAVAVLAEAFMADPFYVFVLPRERARRRWLFTYMRALLAMTLPDGGVYAVDGTSVAGVIIAMAPGRYPPPRRRFYPFLLRMLGLGLTGAPTPRRLVTLVRALGAVDRVHPTDPHWYVDELAVNPHSRGQGVGRRLLDAVLSQADEGGHPVYLETTNEKNLAMYRHFGFDLKDTLQCPGGGPTIWTMLRRTR